MFKILVLICAGTDPSACTRDTALDVIQGPVASMQQCLFGGQAQLAGTALVPEPGKQVVKVICRPVAATAER